MAKYKFITVTSTCLISMNILASSMNTVNLKERIGSKLKILVSITTCFVITKRWGLVCMGDISL